MQFPPWFEPIVLKALKLVLHGVATWWAVMRVHVHHP